MEKNKGVKKMEKTGNNDLAIYTPVLESKYVSISEPKLKYKSTSEYEYSVTLILDRELHKEFIDQIDQMVEDSWNEQIGKIKPEKVNNMRKKYPYRNEYENEIPTGRLLIEAVSNEIKPDGTKRVISIVDTKNNMLPSNIIIGRGSMLIAKCFPRQTFSEGYGTIGIRLYLLAVQIHKLVEYKRDDFDQVEGGYVVPVVDQQINSDEIYVNDDDVPF